MSPRKVPINPTKQLPESGRRLRDLEGVGPRTLEDFEALGVASVEQLRKEDPHDLFERLCEIKGVRVDPCCLDVFTCAVAQAKDSRLSPERRKWWFWSRVRKGEISAD